MIHTYGLTLSGFALPGNADPLGVCAVAPAGATAFSAGEAAPTEPTWRVQLPESPTDARAILDANAELLRRQQDSLALIRQELNSFTRQGDMVSFAPVSTESEQFAAQKEALRATLDIYAPPPGNDALTPFGLLACFKKEKQAVPQQAENQADWLAFIRQAEQTLSQYVRIETALPAPHLVGVTRVSWIGDFNTVWRPGLAAEAGRLHRQAVNVALTSRLALLRVIAVVAGGAAGLAAKAAALPPGGQVVLLPAAWRFVKDVLAELRKSWPQLQSLV